MRQGLSILVLLLVVILLLLLGLDFVLQLLLMLFLLLPHDLCVAAYRHKYLSLFLKKSDF